MLAPEAFGTFALAMFFFSLLNLHPNLWERSGKRNDSQASVVPKERCSMKVLIIKVIAIEGNCPVYRLGDRIVIEDGFRLNLEETDAVCMHSLASLMPYYVALSKGVSPRELGLAGEGDRAYVQCLDPARYTGGGTVTFEVEICEREP
ncbi:MAG: TIGR04076 family protein [Candidatus Hadarchaeota archaeon]|nr:TIGR04076 family protein [Candidatus Hadarchaeota archaeon]